MELNMFEMFLYIFCVLAAILVASLILPVKFYINASGGTEGKIEISVKIMLFSGVLGGGFAYYRDNRYYLTFFIYSWRVISINLKPLVDYFSDKRKREKKVKKVKEKPLKKKRPVLENIKIYYNKGLKYRGYTKPVFRDLREIVRIDLFSTHVKLGLKNPCLTGKIVGLIYAINGILPEQYVITPSWDFSKTTLQGKLNIKITFLSHLFWKKLIIRLPLIISIIREHKAQKQFNDNNLAVKEAS